MSLKAIKELAKWVKAHHGGAAETLADEAWGEIAALENAAADIQAETDAADGDTSDREMRRYLSAMALFETITREASE